jgi:hypothetical protein
LDVNVVCNFYFEWRIPKYSCVDGITIHYHLAIPTIISFVGLLIIVVCRRRLFPRHPCFWTSVTVFFALYLFVVGSALYNDIYYQWDLSRYDLDKDGIFGGNEITEDQKAAMLRLTSDVGRNFSFITGFVFALTIAVAVYVFGTLTSALLKRARS